MDILQKSARRVVKEISNIISYPINIMDQYGIIIASSDESRIGMLHGGAKKILEEGLGELVITVDNELIGTKQGVNLPINLEGKTIGVVGITGEKSKVEEIGLLIQKMTEILIVEISSDARKRLTESIRNRFVEEWVFNSKYKISPQFILQGKQLGISIMQPWRILVLSIVGEIQSEFDPLANQQTMEQLEKTIKHHIAADRNNLFIKTGTKYIILLQKTTDEHLRELFNQIQADVLQKTELYLAAGADSETSDGMRVHASYIRADKALTASIASKEKALKFYRDIDIELFINEISQSSKEEFIRKIFAGCTEKQIKEWVQLLEVYFDSNASIGQSAQKLYIHKNTMQNRLKKLAELTKYDPRNINHAALYYLVIQFYNEQFD